MSKFIVIAICFCLALVLGIGFLWPKYQDFENLQKEIVQKQTDLHYIEEYFAKLRQTSDKLKEYSENLQKIDSALPPDFNLPPLFDFLQKTAAQSGLILKEVSPVSITPFEDSKIQEVHLSLSLSGSYSSFKDFLLTLQKSARLIEVESIAFSSPEKEEIFTLNLKIKVYSY